MCNHDCNQGRDCDCHVDEDLANIGHVFYLIKTLFAGFGIGSALVLCLLWAGYFK